VEVATLQQAEVVVARVELAEMDQVTVVQVEQEAHLQ
jgi:hypothetical protein